MNIKDLGNELVFSGDKWYVIEPQSYETFKAVMAPKWGNYIRNEQDFNFTLDAPIYILINRENNDIKYLIDWDNKTIKDVNNINSYELQKILVESPDLYKFCAQMIEDYMSIDGNAVNYYIVDYSVFDNALHHKDGLCIIDKGTYLIFVFPWMSDGNIKINSNIEDIADSAFDLFMDYGIPLDSITAPRKLKEKINLFIENGLRVRNVNYYED